MFLPDPSLASPQRFLCPAKLNLNLLVTGKRPDGYHELVSVALPISLADELWAQAASGFSLGIEGPFAPALAGEDVQTNLLCKAWNRFAAPWGVPPLAIRLVKNIPPGGGLGGGSSDVATLLRLMAALASAPPGPEQLHAAARQMGADAPFFLLDGAALMEGTGERLTPIPLRKDHRFTVVFPGQGMSTAQAYGLLKAPPVSWWRAWRHRREANLLAKALTRRGSVPPDLLRNDFEAITPRPQGLGHEWRLSGSGACWFTSGWWSLTPPKGWSFWRVNAVLPPMSL